MYIILCKQTYLAPAEDARSWEITYDRRGKDPFLTLDKIEAEEYLHYLQKEFAHYREKPIYKIMQVSEIEPNLVQR